MDTKSKLVQRHLGPNLFEPIFVPLKRVVVVDPWNWNTKSLEFKVEQHNKRDYPSPDQNIFFFVHHPWTPNMPTLSNFYNIQDASNHNTKDDCWIIVDGKVLTNFSQLIPSFSFKFPISVFPSCFLHFYFHCFHFINIVFILFHYVGNLLAIFSIDRLFCIWTRILSFIFVE